MLADTGLHGHDAAIVLTMLGDAEAAAILRLLEPDELQALGTAMVTLGDVAAPAITAATDRFVTTAAGQPLARLDPHAHVEALLTTALGADKADGLLSRIPRARASAIELARWLDPGALTALIRDEHPQAIAVLLTTLEPEAGAQVLAALPEAAQPDIVHRIATLGPVNPAVLAMLDALLARRIAQRHGPSALAMGGPREAAEILNKTARTLEKRVMPAVAKRDKAIAKAIEAEMFKFEHLFTLDDKSMGTLLRAVNGDTLIVALKGIMEEDRELFYRAMSSRAADGVRDDVAARGRLRLAEVHAAQVEIVAEAKKLAAEGSIMLAGGDAEYV